jgi:hypothetical protein
MLVARWVGRRSRSLNVAGSLADILLYAMTH